MTAARDEGKGPHMTSTIRVSAGKHPVVVTAVDRVKHGADATEYRTILAILTPGSGDHSFHCSKTRTVECVELEPDDQRVPLKTPEIS